MKDWMLKIPKRLSKRISEKKLYSLLITFFEEWYHSIDKSSFKSFNFFWRERLSREERKILKEFIGEIVHSFLKERKRVSLKESSEKVPKEIIQRYFIDFWSSKGISELAKVPHQFGSNRLKEDGHGSEYPSRERLEELRKIIEVFSNHIGDDEVPSAYFPDFHRGNGEKRKGGNDDEEV